MNDIEAPNHPDKLTRPVTGREGLRGFVILLSLGLAVAVAALAFLSRGTGEPLVLGLLAGLAMVGVFFLFAASIGLVRLGDSQADDRLLAAYASDPEAGLQIRASDGTILHTNAAFYRLLGGREDAGPPRIELICSASGEVSEQLFRLTRAAERGEAWREDIRRVLPAPEGQTAPSRVTWLRVSVRPARMPGTSGQAGKTDRLSIWRVTDVTAERLAAEELSRQAEARKRDLDRLPAGVFTSSRDGYIITINATLRDWLGLKSDRAGAGLRIADIVLGDGAALLTRPRWPIGDRPARPEILDIDLVRADGTSLPVRMLHCPPTMEGGQAMTLVLDQSPEGGLASTGDAARVRFARFFHAAPIAIATVNAQGRIGHTNAAFARMFEQGLADGAVRTTIFEHVHEDDVDDVQVALEAAIAGQAQPTPVDITLAGDSSRTGRLYFSHMAGGDETAGQPGAAIIYAVDTTELKALEIEFAQSQKMQVVGQLAGDIAHDFNNVLQAIYGFVDHLLTSHRPTDPAFRDIQSIKDSAVRAADLVAQLLAFSRRQTLRPKVLSLTDIISSSSRMLRRLLGETITLDVVHGRDLWLVKTDAAQFGRVIVNLAVNARDAMPEGGRLTIRTRNVTERDSLALAPYGIERGEYVLCEVEDTGCGIAPEHMNKIFEPFFSTKEVGKGTGLGLSSVYGIVKQSGGHILADSTLGQGTVFRIYLPRCDEKEERLAEQEAIAAVGEPQGEEAPKRFTDLTGTGTILMVEDEDDVREVLSRSLSARGYQVLQAASGVEALEVVENHAGALDLVISDVMMPEMDGPTLLKELRARIPDIKIIFMSGYAEDAFKKTLADSDEFVFLPKPVSLRPLAETVKTVIQGRTAGRHAPPAERG